MKIVFNSSLPRSGSTLLQNILAQNPEFHCTPTSGVLELLYGARNNFTTCPEFKAQDQGDMNKRFSDFCNGGLTAFYWKEMPYGKVIVDKSRGWMAYYDWVATFLPNPKIICCVRDLRAIFASMEKLYRANPNRAAFGEDPGNMKFLTVDARVGYWMSNPPIGLGLARLADAIQRKTADNFHFVRFEDLTSNGTKVLDGVYEFIGEPRFEHDLFNVEQKTHEDDSIYGMLDLHVIRQQVKPVKPDWNEVLGKELSQAIVIRYKWFYERFYDQAA